VTDPIYRFDVLQRLLSPWFGFKEDLSADYGLSLGFDYQTLLQRVTDSPGEDGAAGAIFRAYGSWTLLGRDSDTSGSLVFKVEHRQRLGTDLAPQDLGFDAGALAITGTQFSDVGWALTNLYWQQRLRIADRRVSFVAGQVDVTDYLDVYGMINPLTAFSNLSFSTDPSIAAPNPGLGLAAGAFLSDRVYAVAGFADANGDPTDPSFDLFDDFETFKHVEIGWTSSYERRYFDNIHLTAWQVDERDDAGVPDDRGVAFSASWFVDNRWVPFLRGGWSDGDAALLQSSVRNLLSFSVFPKLRDNAQCPGDP
jgi:porin